MNPAGGRGEWDKDKSIPIVSIATNVINVTVMIAIVSNIYLSPPAISKTVMPDTKYFIKST